jgi:hypothetical protein
MTYEINVTKSGKHYFATHHRSLTDPNTIADTVRDFRQRFPKAEGFGVTLHRIETASHREMVDGV